MASHTQAQLRRPIQPQHQVSWLSRLLAVVLTLAFLAGGGYSGYIFYVTVKDVVAHAELPTLPYVDLTLPVVSPRGNDFPNPRAASNPQPVTGLSGESLPDWEEDERVNVLLLGIDKRPDEQYARTDTMILVTVDPATGKAGMLSIPRDLWVTIPGYGENRINTAHYLGDKNGYPGGGPALAMKTVQYNLGVPVHFYVRVDFDGFRRIVDTLGGIDIDAPQTINDPKYPDENYGYDPFYIQAGPQHLAGDMALKYARTRATAGSDFDRARRQQQVLFAIREKALAIGVVPKIPDLWATMADTVQTDLQLVDILELAKLSDKITGDDIQSAVVDHTMTVDYTTSSGAQVLLPVREKIRPVIDRIFSSPEPAGPPPTPTPDPVLAAQAEAEAQAEAQRRAEVAAALQTEGAKIVVQNGTPEQDLAATTAEYLRDQGFTIVQFGPADRTDYPRTVIVDYTGKTYALMLLSDIFNVADENIRRSPNLKSEVDIRVIIGADFQLPEARSAQSIAADSFISPTGGNEQGREPAGGQSIRSR
ncbi:MAG: LCP family protein [Anaerolineae bacterium]|jgi:LCP family protein required for cell wall assembly